MLLNDHRRDGFYAKFLPRYLPGSNYRRIAGAAIHRICIPLYYVRCSLKGGVSPCYFCDNSKNIKTVRLLPSQTLGYSQDIKNIFRWTTNGGLAVFHDNGTLERTGMYTDRLDQGVAVQIIEDALLSSLFLPRYPLAPAQAWSELPSTPPSLADS